MDAGAARGRHITLESYHLRIHLRGPIFLGGTPPDPIEGALCTLSPASNSVPPLFFIPGSAPDYHIVPTMHESIITVNNSQIITVLRAVII